MSVDSKTTMKQSIGFLLDVFLCSLSSFGGPEAHYGVFSQILVHKKKYIDEKTLSELIGVFSLVPGPSSTQTITAIGYLVGGPIIAFLTFLIWALPALMIMTFVGVFFSLVNSFPIFTMMLSVLPPIAVGFIVYAGWTLTKRMVFNTTHWILFIAIGLFGFFLIPLTFLAVPLLLITSGLVLLLIEKPTSLKIKFTAKPKWILLLTIVLIAILGELLAAWLQFPWLNVFNSFYRYGYTVIGGGQIVIPLMIQDLVNQQSLISLETFLSGYAIDQAIPGPLFSFAAFVGTQSLSGTPLAWLGGLLSGLSIFIPGIIFVYFMVPIWKAVREVGWMKVILKGITIAAASLIVLTAFNQILELSVEWFSYTMVGLTFITLIWKKIPTPILVGLLITMGLLIQSIN
jgi:chromate transporter